MNSAVRSMARIGILLPGILAWLMPVCKTAALVLTLEQALQRAREENLGLRIENIGLKLAASEVTERQSDYIPALEISVSYGRSAGRAEALDLQETERIYSAAITQKVPLGGRLSLYYQSGVSVLCRTLTRCDPGAPYVLVDQVRESSHSSEYGLQYTHNLLKDGPLGPPFPAVEEARRELRIHREARAASLSEVIYRATTGFYELLHAQEMVRIDRHNLAIFQSLLALADSRLKLGLIAGMGLMSARVQLGAARQSLLGSLSAREQARQRLADLLNLDVPLEADGRLHSSALPLDLETAVGRALRRNPAVARVKREIEKQELALAMARNHLLPELDLSARVSRIRLEEDETRGSGREVQVGLAFHYPFHDQGLRENHRQRELELQALRLRLEELQTGVRLELAQVFARLELARSQLAVLSAQADTLKRRFDLVMSAFEEGLVSIDEVHDTRQDLVQNRKQTLGLNLDTQRLLARVRFLAGEGRDPLAPSPQKAP